MMMGGSQVLHKLMFWLHLHKYRLLKCLHLSHWIGHLSHWSGHFNKSLVDGHRAARPSHRLSLTMQFQEWKNNNFFDPFER